MMSQKFFKLVSVAVGGYLAGVSTEKFFKVSFEDDGEQTVLNHGGIRPRPGLPIFGTVSAATLIPSKSNLNETKLIPPEPAHNAPRVSQVFKAHTLQGLLTERLHSK